jgi:hypothetical protein
LRPSGYTVELYHSHCGMNPKSFDERAEDVQPALPGLPQGGIST